MRYYEIFDLKREPFSNSPDPEFLYRSKGHAECLNALEISIRLHRGLCVVLGEVGAGKSTLCRRLLQELADDEAVATHLILDPAYDSPRDLLLELCALLAPGRDMSGEGDWRLRETVKEALFSLSVEQGKTLALILDEGQKLTGDCMEVLRELLNYETNTEKLVQVVIFAQLEFREAIAERPNFADRINETIELPPLSLRETKALVRFRLDRAHAAGSAPDIFTPGGYLALHRATGGHPRKIVTLCHKIMLALIVQNKRRAGWTLVANRSGRSASRGMAPALAAACILLLAAGVAAWGLGYLPNSLRDSAPKAEADARTAEPSPAPAPAIPAASAAPEPAEPHAAAAPAPPPEILGVLSVNPGELLSGMILKTYGVYRPELLRALALANPGVPDLDNVSPGTALTFPVMDRREADAFKGLYWVALGQRPKLEEAFAALRSIRGHGSRLRLLPNWTPRQGLAFDIVLFPPYRDRPSARSAIGALPPEQAAEARVVDAFPGEAELYSCAKF